MLKNGNPPTGFVSRVLQLTHVRTAPLSPARGRELKVEQHMRDRILGGKYRIIKKIGAGGMGMVYEATHISLDAPVALKVLHSSVSSDAFRDRFLSEAKAAARVINDHVMKVTDFGVEDEMHFIVMEYLHPSKPLLDLIIDIQRGVHLPWERARNILVQICAGLEAVHAEKLVHRDIKPTNIVLISKNGDNDYVKIIDFGVVKELDPDVNTTQTGVVLGTPKYMSPEQSRGMKDIDARSDIYSVGLVAYELLTGRAPFDADPKLRVDAGTQIISMHQNAIPMAPSLLKPTFGIPNDIEKVVMTALEKKPENRFSTARAMADALRRCGTPAKETPPEARRSVELPSSRREFTPRATFSLERQKKQKSISQFTAAAVIGTIAIALGVTAYFKLKPSKIENPAVIETSPTIIEPQTEHSIPTPVPEPALVPAPLPAEPMPAQDASETAPGTPVSLPKKTYRKAKTIPIKSAAPFVPKESTPAEVSPSPATEPAPVENNLPVPDMLRDQPPL